MSWFSNCFRSVRLDCFSCFTWFARLTNFFPPFFPCSSSSCSILRSASILFSFPLRYPPPAASILFRVFKLHVLISIFPFLIFSFASLLLVLLPLFCLFSDLFTFFRQLFLVIFQFFLRFAS